MNKLKLTLDFYETLFEELNEYLSSIDGINDVVIDNEKDVITLEYDSSIIPTKMIKKEIDVFLRDLKTPNLWGFNKFSKDGGEATLTITNLCCEYCLKGYIEELFNNDAISFAKSDFDFKKPKDVKIIIKYDSDKLNINDIKAIEENFNK